eukprot:scaffold39028_cov22-Cyclotella_meneghiniana.AAC.1
MYALMSTVEAVLASPPAGPRNCTYLEISAGDKVPVFTEGNKDDHFNSNDKRSKSADTGNISGSDDVSVGGLEDSKSFNKDEPAGAKGSRGGGKGSSGSGKSAGMIG